MAVGGNAQQIWSDNLHTEVAYWDQIISGRYRMVDRVELFKQRAAGEYPFPPHLRNYLKVEGMTRIIDVGAGPHTVIGWKDIHNEIEIVAVDPLANEYNALFDKYEVKPAVRTQFGEAEKLCDYNLGLFDLVYSRNALDHAYDPVAAIDAMLAVTKPSGVVFIEGSINEGEKHNYQGLHQWNFLPEATDLIVWRENVRTSLSAHLASKAKVSSQNLQGTWFRAEIAPV